MGGAGKFKGSKVPRMGGAGKFKGFYRVGQLSRGGTMKCATQQVLNRELQLAKQALPDGS